MSLITIIGAGAGISLSVAKKFGNEGYSIALISRSEENLKTYVNELEKDGIEAIYEIGDASNENSLKRALFSIKERKGHADMILYNAAAVSVKDILEQDWQTIKDNLDVTVGGAFHLLKTVVPFCLENDKGKLFFTGGGFALGGDPEWTSLSIGKAALRNLLEAYVKKLEGTNVHLAHLIVCGFVNEKDEKYNPELIAEEYWKLFSQKKGLFQNEVIY